MPIKLRPGDAFGPFSIIEPIDTDSQPHRHAARGDGLAGQVEVVQYFSPTTPNSNWGGFAQNRRALLEALAANPEAHAVALPVHEALHDVDVRGHDRTDKHTELLLVTAPRPPSLQSLLEDPGMTGERRLAVARQAALAMAAVHHAGIDWVLVDPSNIGVRDDDTVVFTDFSCATVRGDAGLGDNPSPMSVPGYGAPEIAEGEDASAASDVYALAKVVEALLQVPPAKPGDPAGLISELPPAQQERLQALLRAAGSADPACRPSAQELAAALGDEDAGELPQALADVPDWLPEAIQSLAFWVAYQHQIYRHHRLPEGAIVAELTRLVDAEVGRDLIVLREPLYRTFPGADRDVWPDLSRADLAVRRKGDGKEPGAVEAVIEVKRAASAAREIDRDIAALHQLRASNPAIRTFVLLVSQAGWPRRWVNVNGNARRDVETVRHRTADGVEVEIALRVRRVTKAAHSFKSIDKASFCCLVEVM